MDYPEIEKRIAETYAARSTATLKNSLYDTYKMAIRWASDRIVDQGIVAFVTNGSWIDGNVDSGVRACLAEEFSSVYVLNLRGNARTSGERRRAEGDNAFGQGSRAPVAITLLVRNPDAAHEGCRILYRDVGDYLTREEKLAILHNGGSVADLDGWREVAPDRHHDWIVQRDETFQRLYPIGSKEVKTGRGEEAIFSLFSNGYKTGRDAYVYNFSRDTCADNARKMVANYQDALRELEDNKALALDLAVNRILSRYSSNLRWDDKLKNRVQRRATAEFFRGLRSGSGLSTIREAAPLCRSSILSTSGADRRHFPGCRQGETCDLRTGSRLYQAIFGPHRGHDAGPSLPSIRPMPSAIQLRAKQRIARRPSG